MPGTENNLRISVIGLAGAGKSTCAGLIEQFAADEGLTHERIKLADPLYRLQEKVYATAGAELTDGGQDQILMEALAEAMRRIRPESLIDDFLLRLRTVEANVVVNDDLRDPYVDAPALRARGFRVVRVTCTEDLRQQRLIGRGDPSRSDRSTLQIHLIEADAVIDNGAGIEEFRGTVHEMLRSWL